VTATLNVSVASELLQTSFGTVHRSGDTDSTIVRAGRYGLPIDVAEAVAAVYGLHGLPTPTNNGKQTRAAADNEEVFVVTPAIITSSYGPFAVAPTGELTNRQAVAEFQDNHMSERHLAKFFETYVTRLFFGLVAAHCISNHCF
jgi:hypothetical protein